MWTKFIFKSIIFHILAPFLPALAKPLACVQSHQWGRSWHPLQLQVVKWTLSDQKNLRGRPQGRYTLRQKSPIGPKVVSTLSLSCQKIVTMQFLKEKKFPKVSQCCLSQNISEIWGMVNSQEMFGSRSKSPAWRYVLLLLAVSLPFLEFSFYLPSPTGF